jgi:ATP-dependent DNA helicase RecG
MAAQKRYEELQQILGDKVGLIHGQMKNDEKDKIMADFIVGQIRVLVSTTVIEVGVDVPNATLMIIEHAERFGLAALHQLRGRIGRGAAKSTCILLSGHKLTHTAKERLAMMRKTDDGFEIAELDLKLRGAGEVMGIRQSGWTPFTIADEDMVQAYLWTALKDAQTILALDPHLESPRGLALRTLLYLFSKDKAFKMWQA